jgi:hypothetical protein
MTRGPLLEADKVAEKMTKQLLGVGQYLEVAAAVGVRIPRAAGRHQRVGDTGIAFIRAPPKSGGLRIILL